MKALDKRDPSKTNLTAAASLTTRARLCFAALGIITITVALNFVFHSNFPPKKISIILTVKKVAQAPLSPSLQLGRYSCQLNRIA
tara:strand:- start:184 stop:438 length:255 start_codon:yes stop_codon:yes gene_type:complete